MLSNKRIAFVANTSWSIYRFRLYLIEKLLDSGFSVHVLAPRDNYTPRFEDLPGLTYVELKHFRGKSISPMQDLLLHRELLRHYRRIRPSLIFHYTIKANIFGALAASRLGIPAVGVITGLGYTFSKKGILRQIASMLYKWALRKSMEVWFLNEDDMDLFVTEKLVQTSKAFLLPGEGVDPEVFYPAPFEPGQKDIVFLYVGRMLRNKGIPEFVQAAGLLRQQGLSVKCQLLGFFDGSPAAISREEVEDWHNHNIITYLGHTDKVADFIRQADCVVLPSYYREGVPLSLLEGASMCKALIAADTSGCRSLIEEGINGYLCREKDPGDLARKMEMYYHLSAADKKKMGMEGRKKVLENFTSQRIAGIYLEKISLLQGVTHELV